MKAYVQFETHNDEPVVVFTCEELSNFDSGQRTSLQIRQDRLYFPYLSEGGWVDSAMWIKPSSIIRKTGVTEFRVGGEAAKLLSPGMDLRVSVMVDGTLILDDVPCNLHSGDGSKSSEGTEFSLFGIPRLKLRLFAVRAGAMIAIIAIIAWQVFQHEEKKGHDHQSQLAKVDIVPKEGAGRNDDQGQKKLPHDPQSQSPPVSQPKDPQPLPSSKALSTTLVTPPEPLNLPLAPVNPTPIPKPTPHNMVNMNMGQLFLKLSPPAYASLDDFQYPDDGMGLAENPRFSHLEPGTYRLTVRREGYKTDTQTITIQAGITEERKINLQKD